MKKDILLNELKFKAIRSSGSGGQHVNKVSSKIELQWDVVNTNAFSEEKKEKLQKKLSNRINKEGILILQTEETRSQFRNKELAIKKLMDLIKEALKKKKKRIKTKVPKAVKQKRLDNKSRHASKKATRKKPDINFDD